MAARVPLPPHRLGPDPACLTVLSCRHPTQGRAGSQAHASTHPERPTSPPRAAGCSTEPPLPTPVSASRHCLSLDRHCHPGFCQAPPRPASCPGLPAVTPRLLSAPCLAPTFPATRSPWPTPLLWFSPPACVTLLSCLSPISLSRSSEGQEFETLVHGRMPPTVDPQSGFLRQRLKESPQILTTTQRVPSDTTLPHSPLSTDWSLTSQGLVW